MKTAFKFVKEHPHLCAILAFIIIGLFAFAPWVSISECLNRGDVGNEYTPFFYYHQKAMLEQGEVPLWSHQISSGTPFFAVGDKPILYPFTILSLLVLDYGPAFNWNVLFHLILCGVGMYFLAFYLTKKPEYAFISGLVYMLNFHMFRKMQKFWGVAWVPIVLLCFYYAFNEKDLKKQIGYSILGGLSLAMIFHVGSIEIALYSILIIVFLSLFRLISKKFPERAKQTLIIGIVSGLFFAGFIAIKLLPNYEFGQLTTRAQGISLEQAKGSYFYWLDVDIWEVDDNGLVYAPKSLILNLFKGCQKGACTAIGLIPTLLLLASLPFWKKKNVLFHWGILVFAIFMVTASFVFEFFFNHVPGFDKLQHAERLGIIFIFAASVLVAYGANHISNWAQKKYKIVKKHKEWFYVALVAFILIDMIFIIGFSPVLNTYEFGDCREYRKAPIMQYLSTQYDPEDPFRVKVYESKGRGGVAQYITMPLGLDTVDGQYGGLWIPSYINQYLAIAQQQPAKMWGNLNAKYITMQEKREVNGLTYKGSFEGCDDCIQNFAAGPHLYENSYYLPRAFWADQAILIVGKSDQAIQSGYALMLNDLFDLNKVIVVHGDKTRINEYSIEELSRFKAVMLMPGSVDANSNFIMQRYVDQGGQLVPNVLSGQQTVTVGDIQTALGNITSNIKPLKVIQTPNSITVNEPVEKGFLVVNSKMHVFPGWKVTSQGKTLFDNNNQRLTLTNMMLSSIYIKEPTDKVKFEYKPDSFTNGAKITMATIVLALLFGLYLLWKKKSQ